MGAVNAILTGYKIQTWEEYRQITLADFIRIHRIFLELAFNA